MIDSLSSFKHKYKNDLHTITKRILSLIQEYKITAVLTILATQKSGFEITEEDLFSLFQNIIVLRFVEVQGRMKRVLLVLKTRGSQHDNSILEFNLSKDNGGAEISGQVDKECVGILTGIAQRGQ